MPGKAIERRGLKYTSSMGSHSVPGDMSVVER